MEEVSSCPSFSDAWLARANKALFRGLSPSQDWDRDRSAK